MVSIGVQSLPEETVRPLKACSTGTAVEGALEDVGFPDVRKDAGASGASKGRISRRAS
jgi:hypothetical protein